MADDRVQLLSPVNDNVDPRCIPASGRFGPFFVACYLVVDEGVILEAQPVPDGLAGYRVYLREGRLEVGATAPFAPPVAAVVPGPGAGSRVPEGAPERVPDPDPPEPPAAA
jgi:hypothetical protein